ncbi:alginate O-acetyltransferase AlgX-related protein [Candidatus Magnetominusculus dajiuhuensis]|uniref:alginate O-acetyltransferase AlgX-related protein n=1 Tax=Candidatus Magnetominusculus dajiuhuensis TaxID=3137712 RepID=UPI003B42EB28
MIVDNNSWTRIKAAVARYLCSALALKLLIVVLAFSSAYLFFRKLDSYLIIRVFVEMRSTENITPRVYFHDENGLSEENSVTADLKASDGFKVLKFKCPKRINKITALSLLLGDGKGVIAIKSIRIMTLFKEYKWSPEEIYSMFPPNNVERRNISGGALYVYPKKYPAFLTNWQIASTFDDLVRSIDKHYLWNVCTIMFAILCLVVLWFVRFPQVELYCKPGVVISLVFLVFISLPLLSTFLMITYKVNISEQRTLASNPRLSIANLAKFPDQYTQYFEDNFGFRDMLIRWNNRFKVTFLKNSPIPEQVIFGRDGWLYMTALKTLEDYRGNAPFTQDELLRIRRVLLARQRWLRDRGINYYLLIPPNKETIYPEYLPDYINKVGNMTRIDQIIGLMDNPTFNIIDLRDTLINAKHKGRLYFKTDTHWNSYGAFWGYQKIISTLGKDYPRLVPMDISGFKVSHSVKSGGDLYRLLSVSDLYTDDKMDFKPLSLYKSRDAVPGDYINTYRNPENPLIVKEVNDSGLPKIVVFRDSFFMHPLSFFAEHFRRSVYVWTREFDTDIIEKEKPDIVITEIVERNLYTLKDAVR